MEEAKGGRVWGWMAFAFFLLLALAYLPYFSGFVAIAAALMVLPLRKWQETLRRVMPKPARIATIILLALLSVFTAPAVESETPTLPTELTQVTTEETTLAPTQEEQTEATILPTEEASQETTVLPTEETVQETTVPPIEETIQATTIPATEETTLPPTTEETTTQQPVSEEASYVVNTNTGKFHRPTCSSVKDIKEENRWDYFGTREALEEMGYVACKRCKP